ncbi:MAG: SRPBCC domain-containing protein [Candidatus Promineifilaceae bacterium]
MSKNNLVIEREKLSFSMSRVFNAPRDLVWNVVTDPALIPEWWGRRHSTTIVAKMDFKVGGGWRYIERDTEGNEHPFKGIYKEIDPPHRLVYTFEYEPFAGHVSTDTITLKELPDGKTKLLTTTTFDTLEDLEGMIQSGMEDGATETWDQLEELLEKVVAQTV